MEKQYLKRIRKKFEEKKKIHEEPKGLKGTTSPLPKNQTLINAPPIPTSFECLKTSSNNTEYSTTSSLPTETPKPIKPIKITNVKIPPKICKSNEKENNINAKHALEEFNNDKNLIKLDYTIITLENQKLIATDNVVLNEIETDQSIFFPKIPLTVENL